MPIHIKELLVRTIITPKPEPDKEPGNPNTQVFLDKEALVIECVEQVIKQLNYQQER